LIYLKTICKTILFSLLLNFLSFTCPSMFPVWHNSRTTKYLFFRGYYTIYCVNHPTWIILVLVLVLIIFCFKLIPFVVYFSYLKNPSPSLKQTKDYYFYIDLSSQIIENLGFKLTKYKIDELHITQFFTYIGSM